jgi:hypothetical protein
VLAHVRQAFLGGAQQVTSTGGSRRVSPTRQTRRDAAFRAPAAVIRSSARGSGRAGPSRDAAPRRSCAPG